MLKLNENGLLKSNEQLYRNDAREWILEDVNKKMVKEENLRHWLAIIFIS